MTGQVERKPPGKLLTAVWLLVALAAMAVGAWLLFTHTHSGVGWAGIGLFLVGCWLVTVLGRRLPPTSGESSNAS